MRPYGDLATVLVLRYRRITMVLTIYWQLCHRGFVRRHVQFCNIISILRRTLYALIYLCAYRMVALLYETIPMM